MSKGEQQTLNKYPFQRFAFSKITNQQQKKINKAYENRLNTEEVAICEPTNNVIPRRRSANDVTAKYDCMYDTLDLVANAWKEKVNEIKSLSSISEKRAKLMEIAKSTLGERYTYDQFDEQITNTSLLIQPEADIQDGYNDFVNRYLNGAINTSDFDTLSNIMNGIANIGYENTKIE